MYLYRRYNYAGCNRRENALFACCWLLTLLASIREAETTGSHYANVTLSSLGGDLAVVVFLPHGLKPDERTFYYASRFDHSSMIGSITRKVRTINSYGEEVTKDHILFETDTWRAPHNPYWPESGVGLASEFGAGDDGAFCYYRCGWSGAEDVTNGVLGYREARNGEPFLKIGVGELIKGSCPKCDSTDDYRFNSPYLFSTPPSWKILEIGDHNLSLEHEALLHQHGYKLVKSISLDDNILSVTTSLTNLGQQPFVTAWYSHNFFSCDGNAVGPGYSLDLGLKGDTGPLYDEPGTWTWATPLQEYAKIRRHSDTVNVEMVRALGPGVRIKTEFYDDGATTGAFKLQACGTSIRSEFESQDKLDMYGYNLYIERETLSPEPQLLLRLEPGASKSWTQRVVIGDAEKPRADIQGAALSSLDYVASVFQGNDASLSPASLASLMVSLLLLSAALVLVSRRLLRRRRRTFEYTTIMDVEDQ